VYVYAEKEGRVRYITLCVEVAMPIARCMQVSYHTAVCAPGLQVLHLGMRVREGHLTATSTLSASMCLNSMCLVQYFGHNAIQHQYLTNTIPVPYELGFSLVGSWVY
jgi:hypothetical protein